MIQFEADKKHLTYLLDQIENRDLALPDFQRSFVWDPGATRELVVSIIRSFPAGSLLLLKGGAKIFAPRAFEEAPLLDGTPAYLVLDGQQRLTSLYQAFAGRGNHRFFVNMQELLDGMDVDEAVEVYTASRAKRWESIQAQARDLMLPLWQLRFFADWKDEVLDALEGQIHDPRKLSKQLNELEKEFVKPVELYEFPYTTLGESTPSEAVCTIFETLNRTGVKLSVFELITARAFAHEVKLREMWEVAQAEHPILDDFEIDPYYVLQVVAMMEKGSPKRGVVLGLPVSSIVQRWEAAVKGLDGILNLLREECGVLVSKWVPYYTMLIPMAAAWPTAVGLPGPAEGARRAKLRQWFWCSVFSAAYENTPNSTAERDVQELIPWLEDRGPQPTSVEMFSFEPQRWKEVTYKQRALYRASMALLMRHHPLDFHSAKPLTKQSIEEEGVDDHHIFPRNYLKGSVGAVVDSVLNRTLIDRRTNIRISDKAPSKYLGEMEAELGEKTLHGILERHRLPTAHDGPLFKDRFDDLLEWRIERLTSELAELTGSEIDDHGVLWSVKTGSPEDAPTASGDGTQVGVVVPADIVAFLDLRMGSSARRDLFDQFLFEVLRWPGVSVSVGRSNQSKDGWANGVKVSRRGYGARFLTAFPGAMKVVYRLDEDDASGIQPIEYRQVQPRNPYRIRASFLSEAGVDTCLELARRAYDKTFGAAASIPAEESDGDKV